MRKRRRLNALLVSVMLIFSCLISVGAAQEENVVGETTVLFTHDLHSQFLPQTVEGGGELGGYARLKTVIDREKAIHPNALVLDAGDFSIGSLIQTLYTAQAAELRTMGKLGFDATTAGNHEFDHGGIGFAQMLDAAVLSGEQVPALLMSNYRPAGDNPDQLEIQRAMATYGVKDHLLLERGGITYGLFGLMGVDSDSCAPASGFAYEDRVEQARRCVEQLKKQGAECIICLSHSGTDKEEKKSEDVQLAKEVEGIDLIISGHTHTTLNEPIVVNETYIVSCGFYGRNLGSVTLEHLSDGSLRLAEYRLIPIDETVDADGEIELLVEGLKTQVSSVYLSRYGLNYDQVLTTGGFPIETPDNGVQEGNSLGDLVSDAFLWAVEHLEADAPDVQTIAVTADGVLRASLPKGELTTSMAFDVLSMGVGSDGTSGYPLVGVYLTGEELEAAMEVDASVTPIMPAAQLYMSGICYSFNTHRMFFNRVMDAQLVDAQTQQPVRVEKDRLYRVVTGMYSAQMLGTVKEKSMGILSLEPKMADGSPVTDFEACILRDKNGNEIKEWYALAAYLQSFGEDGVPVRYEQPDGRKDVSHSWNPIQLLKNMNWITLVVLLLAAALVLVVVLIIRWIRAKRKNSRYGKRYRRYKRMR